MLSLDDRRYRMCELLAAPVVGLSYAPGPLRPHAYHPEIPTRFLCELQRPLPWTAGAYSHLRIFMHDHSM
jgi:hypothetical protein